MRSTIGLQPDIIIESRVQTLPEAQDGQTSCELVGALICGVVKSDGEEIRAAPPSQSWLMEKNAGHKSLSPLYPLQLLQVMRLPLPFTTIYLLLNLDIWVATENDFVSE